MKHFLLLIVFCFITISAFGQTPKIDSLKHLVYVAKNEKGKLYAILTLCDESESLPKDTLWSYALKAKALSNKVGDMQQKSLAVLAQANAYLRWDNTDSARILIERELVKYKAENFDTWPVYVKLVQKDIDCTGESSDYKEGSAMVYGLMRQAEKFKDSVVISESMNTLGAWDYDMNFLKRSVQWEYKGISYCSLNNPKYYPVLTGLYLNLSSNYVWVNKYDSAMYFVQKALKLAKQVQNLVLLSVSYENLASVYKGKHEYGKAEQAMLQCLSITRKMDGDEPQPDNILVLASIYRYADDPDKAIKVLNDGLIADSLYKYHSPHSPKQDDSKDLQRVFYYQELARNYKMKHDSRNYEATLEKIINGKDAFYEANSSKEMAEMETKYESQKKEATIAQQKLRLAKENYLLYSSVIFLFLAGIIVWLIFKEVRRKQKLRLQQIHEEEKRLSASAVANAQERERKRIAADLHDNLGAQLSFIKRNVNFIMDQPVGFNQGDERKYLTNVNDIAQNAMIDLRETIWVLNKDDVSIQEFADKLKSYLKQQLMGKEDIRWDFKEDIKENWRLSSGEVMHLFRIVQEVISNIIKHSGADLIDIRLESVQPQNYRLEISDNGNGFDTGRKYDGHYGLENIEQRTREIGAQLSVKSSVEWGTKISLIKEQNNAFELLSNGNILNTFKK